MEMLQATSLCLSCCLVMGVFIPAEGSGSAGPLPTPPRFVSPDLEDSEWGSGSSSSLLHLLHSFPADSPFTSETPGGKPVNCSQRFWLPPSSEICWENIAGPEEFAKSRLLVLQNRAALQAVSTSSGVEEGGHSYQEQAREEVQGIHSDHRSMTETVRTMEEVFVKLQDKRKREGKEQDVFTSVKEHLTNTKDAMDGRERVADVLENNFSTLEMTLLNMQLRLNNLIQQQH